MGRTIGVGNVDLGGLDGQPTETGYAIDRL